MGKLQTTIMIGLMGLALLGCEVQSDAALSKENVALSEQLEQVTKEVKEQSGLNTQLQQTLEEVTVERDTALEIANGAASLSAQRDEAQAQVAALQDQLAGLQSELQATKARELQLSESMNTTLNEFEVVTQELETLKGQLVSSSVDESQRESLIEELQVEQEQVSSQLDVLSAEYLALQEENKTLRTQLDAVNLDTTDLDTTDLETPDETLDSRGGDDADTNAGDIAGGY